MRLFVRECGCDIVYTEEIIDLKLSKSTRVERGGPQSLVFLFVTVLILPQTVWILCMNEINQ